METPANHRAVNRLSAEARRESILNAAIRLFSEKGPRGVTTRELATSVGVSEPILYEHFSNKQEIYEAVYERMCDVALRDLNELMIHAEGSIDTRDFLIRAAEAIATWFRKEPEHVRLVLFSALEHKEYSREAYLRVRSKITGALSRFLEARLTQYGNPSVTPAAMAHTFICMTAHDALMQILFDNYAPEQREQARAQMVEIFLHGVEARQSATGPG